MRIIVLGGDGFCGWPTTLHLSNAGHDIKILDNFARRRADVDLNIESLTPIKPLKTRLAAWKEISGKNIEFAEVDIAQDYAGLLEQLTSFKPDAIVHFAEQRSAPYSMISPLEKRYTVDNNVNATNNLLCAVVESGLDIHVVHLGTMGVYGYGFTGKSPIPEGYVTVTINTKEGKLEKEILHPANPGSIYHMTKVLDQTMFAFYAKNDEIRITDLHQGIVWGTQTDQTSKDERLINRFDYDGIYGTVLNRFLMQSAMDYPLTVYGSGRQTRAFIHIRDTARCIEIAINNPPKKGERPFIFNQATECKRLIDLAKLISKKTGTPIDHLENLRVEAEQNDLAVENHNFLKLGLKPTTLSNGLMEEVTDIARKYVARVDKTAIKPTARWRG